MMAATLFMKVGHVTVKWPRDLCPLVRVPLPPDNCKGSPDTPR